MRKLIYTNERGESVELSSENFRLRELNGIGGADTDIQTQKGAYQDGETYIDTLLEMREISLELAMVAKNNEEIYDLRQKLVRTFNPKLKGELKYKYHGNERVVDVVPDSSPEFPSTSAPTYQSASITLLCPSPFWEDVMPGGEVLGFVSGGLTFPLKLNPVAPEHTIFARRGFEAGLNNQGDVPTPVKITFFGEAENPKIKNNTTGEFIKINQTIGENEKLHINTAFGQKRAEIEDENGEITNAFHYLDLESTFWGLKVGSNDVDFESDISKDKASVEISFRNRYVGI